MVKDSVPVLVCQLRLLHMHMHLDQHPLVLPRYATPSDGGFGPPPARPLPLGRVVASGGGRGGGAVPPGQFRHHTRLLYRTSRLAAGYLFWLAWCMSAGCGLVEWVAVPCLCCPGRKPLRRACCRHFRRAPDRWVTILRSQAASGALKDREC